MPNVPRFMTQVDEHITRFGVHVTAVVGKDEPGFTYTTGLAEQAQPEVLVATLVPTIACEILNQLATKVRGGSGLHAGSRDDLLEGFPAYLLPITDLAVLSIARMRAELVGVHVTALQLCWPDIAGRFPWQAGYDGQRCPQRLFGDPPPPDVPEARVAPPAEEIQAMFDRAWSPPHWGGR